MPFVRLSDVNQLPFYEFWMESMVGSTMPEIHGETFVFLHDWEAFAREFIATGRHRCSSRPSNAEE